MSLALLKFHADTKGKCRYGLFLHQFTCNRTWINFTLDLLHVSLAGKMGEGIKARGIKDL